MDHQRQPFKFVIMTMPQDVKTPKWEASPPNKYDSPMPDDQRSWFRTPESIKRLFNRFPLRTYSANELPLRKTPDRRKHNLYIFTEDDVAKLGLPSFNPGCLKWQAYLKFVGIQFSIVPSNNHASPTGALPFLIPSSPISSANESTPPITSTNLQRWAQAELAKEDVKPQLFLSRELNQKPFEVTAKSAEQLDQTLKAEKTIISCKKPQDLRHNAYMSLINRRIRSAWLYFLYLEPSNFRAVALPLYIIPCSSSFLVRTALAHKLREAAKSELLKQSTVIDVESLYKECDKAFSALSDLLGNDQYFFAVEEPGLFDASVFAYTNVLLDGRVAFKELRMVDGLRNHANLVRHQRNIRKLYFKEPTL